MTSWLVTSWTPVLIYRTSTLQEICFLVAGIFSLANCARYSSLLSLAEFNLPHKKQGLFHHVSVLFGSPSTDNLESGQVRVQCCVKLFWNQKRVSQAWPTKWQWYVGSRGMNYNKQYAVEAAYYSHAKYRERMTWGKDLMFFRWLDQVCSSSLDT